MLDYEKRMRAIVASRPCGPEVLEIEMRATPTPGDREVLIKVAAAGVNGADLRERQGKYPVPAGAPDLMGLEVSGEVVELGQNCDRFRIGDRVCALLIGGGYAEYAIAPEGQCMAIPENISPRILSYTPGASRRRPARRRPARWVGLGAHGAPAPGGGAVRTRHTATRTA